MFAIRARRKAITEKDLIQAIDKVIKGYKKFSATGKYMVYNWSDFEKLFYKYFYLMLLVILFMIEKIGYTCISYNVLNKWLNLKLTFKLRIIYLKLSLRIYKFSFLINRNIKWINVEHLIKSNKGNLKIKKFRQLETKFL